MKKYTVIEKSFINNKLCEPGEIVDYDGEASSNLQPIEEEVKSEPKPKGKNQPESKPQS